MTKFLNVDEIEKKHKKKDFELYQAVNQENGLPAYTKNDLKHPLADFQVKFYKHEAEEADEYIRSRAENGSGLDIMLLILLPYHCVLHDCVFKKSDVLEWFDLPVVHVLPTRMRRPLKPSFLQDTAKEIPAPAEITKKSDIFPIEAPPETTWKQIYFTCKNYDITEIKYPGDKKNKLHKEMGLKQRGKGPLPGALLRLYLPMAALNGYLPAQGNIEVIKANMSRLRQCFRALFPNIPGDPLPFKNNEYQTAFTLRPDPDNFYNQMPDVTKEYVTKFTKEANRIKTR